MTCREKLAMEHPDYIDSSYDGGCRCCPHTYGYLPFKGDCVGRDCYACWNQEIPGEMPKFKHHGEPIAKTKDIYEENGGITAVVEPTIKDSGDRTQFESGAVRDMREGKGRCDLMPLEVVSDALGDPTILELKLFLNTRNTFHLYTCLNQFASVYDDGKTKASEKEIVTQRRCSMFLEVAKHFEEGAKKYGENNWQKGIPVHCYIDSAVRHYLKWLRGDKDEPHDRAFVWNIMCCIWEVDYSPRAEGTTATNDIPPKRVVGKTEAEVITKCGDTVVYLCDGKACEQCYSPDCKHTHDIQHAVNFESVDNGVFGKIFVEKHVSEEEENPDKWVRLEDCPIGLFEFSGKLYLKAGSTVVHVNTGTVEPLHPDILVWPITIEEDSNA